MTDTPLYLLPPEERIKRLEFKQLLSFIRADWLNIPPTAEQKLYQLEKDCYQLAYQRSKMILSFLIHTPTYRTERARIVLKQLESYAQNNDAKRRNFGESR